jgi:oxygen-independent coproporphyrinogen-3 oxidase
VYVHVPWCRRRCTYCDFYFEVGRADERFADALAIELEGRAPPGSELSAGAVRAKADTVYLGGGTPSALSDDAVARVVDLLRRRLSIADDAEVSLEANPEDLPDGRAARLRELGVTRLSLGTQSFDDDVLRWLGRAHTGAQGKAAALAAVDAGLRVSLDLIIGVPDEQEGRLDDDIDALLATGAGHVSTYQLTVEAGTPLQRFVDEGRRSAPDEDMQAEAYEHVQQRLRAAGLRQYEVSSFARPGDESRHNRLYWAQGTWLGLGPGAHSMQLHDDGGVLRRHTTARLSQWLADPAGAAHEDERLSPGHALAEAIAFGLRDLVKGVDLEALAARHRSPVPVGIERALDDAASRGLLTRRARAVALTPLGARFADAVARDVLYGRDREA